MQRHRFHILTTWVATAVITAAVALTIPVEARKNRSATAPRTVNTVRKEQKTAKKSIVETSKRIETNKSNTGRELNRLNSIRADIDRTNTSIAGQMSAVDSIDSAIAGINEQIKQLDARLVDLKKGYAARLHKLQPTMRPLGRWSFILGGKSLSEIYQRMRYVKQINSWTTRRAAEIERVASQLQQQRQQLASLDAERRDTLARLQLSRSQLESSETRSRQIVAGLQKDAAALQKELRQRKERANSLDKELDRLIEADRNKPKPQPKPKAKTNPKPAKTTPSAKANSAGKPAAASSKTATPAAPSKTTPAKTSTPAANPVTTGSFVSARGRMMFPVAGSYRIVKKFGRQKHPDITNVMIDNPGIDVETTPGAQARAVWDGTVSAVFQQPGYHTIVMIRHGDYLTIYGGLASLTVKSGDKVRAGQTIGRVFSDTSDSGRSILHFEVRHEREKLNPLSWVK